MAHPTISLRYLISRFSYENVLPVRLPPYCPEFNPVERLWQDLKQRMGQTLHESLGGQTACAARILRDHSLADLASLCSFASVFAPAFW